MNNDLEGFGQWRRTVDTRLGTLETRVAEQASLRAQMDEDMSELRVEFRAQRTLLQALHDTQQEHSAQLTALQTGQQRIMAGVDTIREMLDRTLNSGNE
jgi:chromosome segregation ATPase